jgi:hypothetical protein
MRLEHKKHKGRLNMEPDFQRFAFDIPKKLHRRLKRMSFELSAERDKQITMRAIVLEAIEKTVIEHESKKGKS